MVTERQIAANRRNARNSTGPRSRAAKRRTRLNAYRHGLAARRQPGPAIANQIDELARQIAGDSNSVIVLELARSAAQAEFDLARVRWSKVALIKQISMFGVISPESDPFYDESQKHHAKVQHLRLAARDLLSQARLVKAAWKAGYVVDIIPFPPMPDPIDPATTMPAQDPERTAEAMRRALPELVKLNRYETRAAARRDRAIRAITKIRSSRDGLS